MNTIWKIISITSFGLLVNQLFFQDSDALKPNLQKINPREIGLVCYIAEEMPRFPGCEYSNLPKRELQSCANQKMLQYVFKNLKYPSTDEGIEGTVVVQFTIEKNGDLTNIKILKGLSPGLGTEITKVIESMPRWIPARQLGNSVRFRFTLPIKIQLE